MYNPNIPVQSHQIQMKFQPKIEPSNTKKIRTTITKKTNPKKTLRDLKNNRQYQQIFQSQQQEKDRLTNNFQVYNSMGPRNSISSNKIKNYNNKNEYVPDNSYLNKYFIYRHFSLYNYLFKSDKRNTLDQAKQNYEKQISKFRRDKPAIPQDNIPKLNFYNISGNPNLVNISNNIDRKKKFIVTGGYSDVVKALTERGWVREKNAKSQEFDYIWTLKTNEINFIQLNNNQMTNHYNRNGQITRKSGLSKNIKNLYYIGADPMNFFPRCYDLSVKDELEDFKQDFKFTWTISLLILFFKEYNEINLIRKSSRKFSSQVIDTCIKIIERHLFLLQLEKGLKDMNNIRNMSKAYLISDPEWNLIYLPELKQNSNIQDIIYEVNSNKPGGINNPIKGKSYTVQKKLITKPNNTKNFLVNMPKMSVLETNKMSPNLQSHNGLITKLNQMNLEEKKNNFNPIKNINYNGNTIIRKKLDLQKKSTNIKPINNKTIKPITILKDGALFEQYIPRVKSYLNALKQFLPQYELNGFRNIWILKPSNLSRGRGVTCVDSLEPIEESLNATNDTGVIVQKYIENPLIINKRKFDIRQWVLVTSLSPLTIWMWKEPYLRFGAEDYIMDDLNNIYSHLTNNSIAKHSEQYKKEKNFEGDMWTCFDFAKFIGQEKWEEIHEKIKNAIICSFYATHQEIFQRANSHELYGYDFMIDENYNVYLIEVNASPALDYSTKITEMLVKEMVKDLIELVIDFNNARDYKIINGQNTTKNKFIQIFNESKDKIEFPKNIPNKNLFY